jgi:hypothetical protein
MNSRSSFVLVSLCLSLGLSLVACSDGASGLVIDGGTVIDPVEAGLQNVTSRKCKLCHQEDMSGTTEPLKDTQTMLKDTIAYSSNLTSDMETGIGGRTDAEIDRAMREGIDYDGVKPLCNPMPIFVTMGDKEFAQILAYLRSLPPVKKKIPESSCPSMMP